MTLTAEECRIAAARARQYPRGFGYNYIGRHVTKDEIVADGRLLYKEGDLPPFSTPGETAVWLQHHPEDLALGCPAMAVAEHRGTLDFVGIEETFDDLVNVLYANELVNDFTLTLHEDPGKIAEALESLAAKMEPRTEETHDAANG